MKMGLGQNIVKVLLESKIFPVVEFSLIISLIIVTYWGLHISSFGRIKPPVKFSISMFLGSLSYIIGKVVVIALFASGPTPDTAYAF